MKVDVPVCEALTFCELPGPIVRNESVAGANETPPEPVGGVAVGLGLGVGVAAGDVLVPVSKNGGDASPPLHEKSAGTNAHDARIFNATRRRNIVLSYVTPNRGTIGRFPDSLLGRVEFGPARRISEV